MKALYHKKSLTDKLKGQICYAFFTLLFGFSLFYSWCETKYMSFCFSLFYYICTIHNIAKVFYLTLILHIEYSEFYIKVLQ